MEFCRLGPPEIDQLAALEALCFSHPWSKAQLANAFDLPNFASFGLRTPLCEGSGSADSAKLVAYLSFYHNPDELEILNLAVAPPWRGHGYGRQLLRLVLRIAAKMDIRRAVLEVRSGNQPALALYTGQGFVQVGLRRGYYHEQGEDALLLALSPLPGS